MNSPFLTRLLFLTGFLCVIATMSANTVLLEETWGSLPEGSAPGDTWKILRADRGSVTIVTSPLPPFGNASRALQLESTDPTRQGPGILATFDSPAQGPIKIVFDFMLRGKCNMYPSVVVRDSAGAKGLYLTLDTFGYQTNGRKIANFKGPSGQSDPIIDVNRDRWYRVALQLDSPELNRYTVSVLSERKEASRVEKLEFRNPLKDFASLAFEFNGPEGEGTLYLANILVVTEDRINPVENP